ncbi:MAG: 50S ribosomal protein L9 [Deltaproteobacteria bacterium]|nr:50S ribosomal protein L9 [Deltaproteobacteria bacterium]
MEIILKEDISSLGKLGEIIKVADGYARNYLLPQGLVVEATQQNIKIWENEKQGVERKLLKLKDEAGRLCEKLEGIILKFVRKAGDDDKLFGSVTSMDIDASLNEQGLSIDRRKIVLSDPIKAIGEHMVAVKLHQDITAHIKVIIEKE